MQDPLGLGKTESSLERFTEAELMNGRWAMLGVAGAVVPEVLGLGDWWSAPLWVSLLPACCLRLATDTDPHCHQACTTVLLPAAFALQLTLNPNVINHATTVLLPAAFALQLTLNPNVIKHATQCFCQPAHRL